MAELHVERKERHPLWMALVVLALIALAVWAVWALFDTEEAAIAEPVATVEPAYPPTQPIDAPVVAGQPVAITAQVVDVPTDRVFLVQEGGRQMAVVVAQSPNMEQAVNVNDDQVVRFIGTYYNTADFAQIEGQLEPQARDIVRNQPGVVIVKASDINVVDADATVAEAPDAALPVE